MRQAALSALTLLVAMVGSGMATEPEYKEVRKTVSIDPSGYVAIETFKGTLTVRTWDKSEVAVHARIEPDGSWNDQREEVDATEVRIEKSGDGVRIKSDYSKVHSGFWHPFFSFSGNSLPFVRYEIHMPRTAKLEIKDFKSDINIDDLRSTLNVNTYKGTTVVSSLDGVLKLHTYKGEARIKLVNLVGPSLVDTYKGEIEIAVPGQKGFNLEPELGRHGTLDVQPGLVNAAYRERHGGAVKGGGPVLRLKTYKGSFRLHS